MRKFFFEIFSPVTLLLKDLVSGAILTVKKSFFKTFLKRGSLEFAHIRYTCGPDLPRTRHALRFDVQFCQGLPRKKVRYAPGRDKVCLISPGTDLPGEWVLLALGSFPGLLRQTLQCNDEDSQ